MRNTMDSHIVGGNLDGHVPFSIDFLRCIAVIIVYPLLGWSLITFDTVAVDTHWVCIWNALGLSFNFHVFCIELVILQLGLISAAITLIN